MKRNVERIFATASFVVALILIVILLVTAFGGIKAEDFNNELVQGLFVTLMILYCLLALTSIVIMFINDEAIKEIVLRSTKDGTTRASVNVVRKMVKTCCLSVEGVKCKGIRMSVSDYGVKLKVTVKVQGKDVEQVEGYLRALIEDEFDNALGFKFNSIEIQFIALEPAYKADTAAIMADADKKLDAKKALQAQKEADKKALDEQIAMTAVATDDKAADVQEQSAADEDAQVDASAPEAVSDDVAEDAPVEGTQESDEVVSDSVPDGAEDVAFDAASDDTTDETTDKQ